MQRPRSGGDSGVLARRLSFGIVVLAVLGGLLLMGFLVFPGTVAAIIGGLLIETAEIIKGLLAVFLHLLGVGHS